MKSCHAKKETERVREGVEDGCEVEENKDKDRLRRRKEGAEEEGTV